MKLYRFLLFLSVGLIPFAFESCKSGNSDSGNAEIETIKFEEAPEDFLPGTRFKNVTCIQLEMTEKSVLGRVKKIIPVDDKLIVQSDDYDVKIFDKATGKYLWNIGSIGEGPEEYLSVQAVTYDPKDDKIIIYDSAGNSFVSYQLDGSFVEKHRAASSMWLSSMESNSEGDLLISNKLSYGPHAGEYAYTLLTQDGDIKEFDPFAPVRMTSYAATFAQKPMTVKGDEFKFIKFQTDSLFSLRNGNIEPLFKLDFGMEILSKEKIMELGQYNSKEVLEYCIKNKFIVGINEIYETSDLMVFIPLLDTLSGYLWLDKKDNKGYHISSSAELESEFEKILEGKTIKYIVGAGDKKFISCFNASPADEVFAQALSNESIHPILPEEVITALKNIDPDGNPFLLIYSN